jgi:hypothetical protein
MLGSELLESRVVPLGAFHSLSRREWSTVRRRALAGDLRAVTYEDDLSKDFPALALC